MPAQRGAEGKRKEEIEKGKKKKCFLFSLPTRPFNQLKTCPLIDEKKFRRFLGDLWRAIDAAKRRGSRGEDGQACTTDTWDVQEKTRADMAPMKPKKGAT